MPLIPPDERARLRAHLLDSGLCGDTATPRSNVVGNARRLAEGDPDKQLGLLFDGLTHESVMRDVAALCGCSPDPSDGEGPGVIDPDRTLAGLEEAASRLAAAGARGERVLIATGHPTALMPIYQRLSRALADRGAKVVTPGDDVRLRGFQAPRMRVRSLDGVGVLCDGGALLHTHSAEPMERLFEELDQEPDLVLADHGYAGKAISSGVETVSFTDVNDPAIAVAWGRALTGIVVPLDDNRPPYLYDPLTDLLERAIRR